MLLKYFARRRARRQLSKISQADRARVLLEAMTPSEAAAMLKELIGTDRDREVDGEVVALVADRAAEGAPEPGGTILAKVAASYRAGRSVGFGTTTAEFRTVTVPPDLEAAVEEALHGDMT
jgi:hypothetical protein